MSKEIRNIIGDLEFCKGVFDYTITPNDCGRLYDYIKELQQEKQQLKENYKAILRQRDDITKNAAETIEKYQQENQSLKEINSFSKRELYKINKDRLDANLKLVEENKKLKEQLELYDNGVIYDSRVDKLESVLDEIREYINNYDVFKEFSFPLMKRDEESQVKSSIDYEFQTSIKKNLLQILDKVKE